MSYRWYCNFLSERKLEKRAAKQKKAEEKQLNLKHP